MAEEGVVAAEGTGSEGTGAADLGATSTEGAGESQAAAGSEQEPELYTVRVDGKEEKVTFEEMQKGYMRQRDYTQKTQTVAAEKAEIAQLKGLATQLENNPRATLVALAGALGVDFGTAKQAMSSQSGDEDLEPWERVQRGVDQLTQQYNADKAAQTAQQKSAAENARVKAQIDGEIAALHSAHGDFVNDELIAYAVKHSIADVSVAWKAWQHDTAEEKRILDLNTATEAKRRAGVVNAGSNAAAGSTKAGTAGKLMTFRESLEAAIKEHS